MVCAGTDLRSNPVASVILCVWGDPKFSDACIDSIERNTHDVDYELRIVDNTGVYEIPDSAVHLNALFRQKENLGWSGGNNVGAKSAQAPILVFANVDMEMERGWLSELLTAFDDPSVGAAGSRLHYPHGAIQHSGITIRRQPGGVYAENRKDEHPTERVDGVTGASLAIRRDLFQEMNGFDAQFWNGADDVDACLTIQSMGWGIQYVSTSRALHHESATDGTERWRRCHENVARLNQKWGL